MLTAERREFTNVNAGNSIQNLPERRHTEAFGFFRSDSFRERAKELSGYDITDIGSVRLVN